ncbi:glycosyltransferase 87 family protein [Catellatospora sp. NPDC049609]|uniref:glycosyltransferase 87 family protein n=1 Tax=Catellatospora sp. NPDC049609 TaxID=3155505 RepID=UPI00342D6D27
MSRGRQIAIVAALAAASLGFVALFAQRHGFFDLNVYYGAIHYWISGGEIYDFVRSNSTYGFTYPPFAALAMLPMAVMSWPAAIVVSATATVLVTWWLLRMLLGPVIAAQRWTPWFVVAVALCLVTVYEPMRETFLFGQVNMLLLGLVAADLLLFTRRGSRWGGVGIGLATAVKLTPGIFIVYLLITKRWREAAVASGTAAAATLVAAAVAPDASREFWTSALWDTDRVGVLSFISNQSLQGVVARLTAGHPSKALWAVLVLAVLAVWFVRSRAAVARGDEVAGFAFTGIVGLLVSPVTWVHHLVWLIPALVLLVERGFAAPPGSGRRRGLLGLAAVSYVILSSRLVWVWEDRIGGWQVFLGANAYVWISLALLCCTPLAPAGAGSAEAVAAQGEPQLGDVDVRAGGPVGSPGAVRV